MPGETLVANVRHDGRWWVARIPPDAVANVMAQEVKFAAPVPAAHSQLQFEFKPGKEAALVPQVEGDPTPPIKLKNLVYSVEACGTEDFKYDLVGGVENKFVNCHRLVSLSDRYKSEVVEHNRPILPYRLHTTDAAKQAILLAALKRGNQAKLKEMYNTLTNSCITNVMHAVDTGAHYDPWHELGAHLTTDKLPTVIPYYLKMRGLWDSRSQMPPVTAERAGYVAKP
jgi:hypothetical protein